MKKYIILIPVYNDWQSVFKLLKEIDFQVSKWNSEVSVLIVNDASTEDRPKDELVFKKIKSSYFFYPLKVFLRANILG